MNNRSKPNVIEWNQLFLPFIFFILKLMKANILISLILILSCSFFAQAQGQTTKLTYFVQHEEDQDQDYIEITLKIQDQQNSLVDAIANAGKVAESIRQLSQAYCEQNKKKGKVDCSESVEVSKFDIQPKYQMVRKEATFSAFIVTHDVTINIYNVEKIGYLVDKFLTKRGVTIKGFEWKALEETDSEEEAVKEGLAEGEGLCAQIGLSLGRVINVEEIIEEEQQEEEKEEGEQQQEEEEPQLTIYKFEVECIPKPTKAQKKK